jgi:hypothetical protein
MRTTALRSDRSTAVSVGVLYLAATLSGGLAAAVLAPLGSLSGATASLAGSASRVWLAVLFEGIMAVSVAVLLPLINADPGSTELSVLHIPMALQELVLAGWLIARGFATPQPEGAR